MPQQKEIINILLIEDKSDYCHALTNLLEDAGDISEIHLCDNAEEAQGILSDYLIDVILISDHLKKEAPSLICMDINAEYGDMYPIILLSHEAYQKNGNADFPPVPIGVSDCLTKGARDFIRVQDIFSLDENKVVIADNKSLLNKVIFWYKAISKNRDTLKNTVKSSDDEGFSTLENIANYNKCDALLIGASTGGVKAVMKLLKELSDYQAPIFIVQHLNSDFEENYCLTLRRELKRDIKLGQVDDIINDGDIIVMPASIDLKIIRKGKNIKLIEYRGTRGHKPRISDVFSSSLTAFIRPIAVILTGLGHDGSSCLHEFHENGAPVLVLDPSLASAPSMNREALNTGYVSFCGSLEKIAFWINKITK